ncbi:MAG: uroporphyrinogen decarboxylase family protein [Anaerolineae bacterium]
MTGKERLLANLAGRPTDRLPCLPILHSGLPSVFDVALGDFFNSARTMADVIVKGYRTFGYDGVQLSLGVTGEAEALGARVEQPRDGAPILRDPIITEIGDRDAVEALQRRLTTRDPAAEGRMPFFYEAVQTVVGEIGSEAFVLATLRGPLLIASQLCGVEALLMAMLTDPQAVAGVLDFTTELARHLGSWLVQSGAHGLILGEATCSPNFISPKLYRALVFPHHQELIAHLRAAGWDHVGLHICGNVLPILEDVLTTGATWVDIDYQVAAATAVRVTDDRAVLRGNLDPSAVFRFGSCADVRAATRALETARSRVAPRWILSSGCDIPPGTPAKNLHAFVDAIT